MKFHTHLPVVDLNQTRVFYESLLGEPPVKSKSDYLKFLPQGTELNLCFSPGTPTQEFLSTLHLGFEFPSVERLNAAEARLRSAGLEGSRRETSICCYANQDKLRIQDPSGYEWELYVVLDDSEQRIEPTTSCCSGAASCG